MDALLSAGEWLGIVVGGLLVRFAAAIALLVIAVAVLLPVVYAFEGGRRLLGRLKGIEDLHGYEWRRRLRYSPAHLWLAERRGAVRIGLDAIAARLLGGTGAVELAPAGAHVVAGAPIARFTSAGATTVLGAPFSGTVARVNARLQDVPDLATAHSYSRGWLLELRPEGEDYRRWPRAAAGRTWFGAEALRLTHALEHATGLAAADGGVPVAPAHQLLEASDFERLATDFLQAKVTRGVD